ncbi:hypothetical protein QWY86_15640 [Pedobacter aquatilis]|uniref:hypothetical protein n=1 Tax=Pedobacter aquatilis TaxID=351343 RepID=UPI0025B3C35B|nr:hypothetical protein [Pedobacter aquatilis]MDN3588116.1 hypothetical protein [Pedobacter aquatilis]
MKIILLSVLGILTAFAASAQNQEIDGNLSIGLDGGQIAGRGKTIYFGGLQSNTDLLCIYRFNRAMNLSDLRVNIGDDFGSGDDRFVIGTEYWADGIFHPYFIVGADGKVGIGTESIGAEHLAVNGAIRAKEVKVETSNWPDYVFSRDYRLPSLSEVSAFIKENGHLPGMPSAAILEKDGVQLGEIIKSQQKQIEEVTLHLIEKDKVLSSVLSRLEVLEQNKQK